MRKLSISVISFTVLVICSSWGFLMHRTISQLSVYQLPKELQPFFYQNMDYLVRNAVRPDERRNGDPTEASKHFIDFEAYGNDAAHQMPLHWEAAVARYSKDSLLKYGYVPYWIMVMKARLTNAFRKGQRDSILFYAADMAHYIEDAHVPLHTSLNYDGQLTNQKGLHALWESVVPELTIEGFNLKANKKAGYLKHPERAVWKAVRHSFSLVPAVLQTERDVSKNFTDETKYRYQKRNGREARYYTKDFALAYAKRLELTINQQALRAANLVADFWYTCWMDAGKPDLNGLLTKKWDASSEEKLQSEINAYRKNELLKDGLLLSKKGAGSADE
ncbi:MAG TPA: zinc dependent phospholipase C family protein [Flavisolibacter sp.]|nr:zinc dependent phospholipase C family protein [Flavisolibacter sp.]